MCTLILVLHANRDLPLVVAANRDEFFARAASTPRRIQRDPPIVAGIDALAGGTWFGVTRDGFFAAVTNFRTANPSRPAPESRGALTRDVLSANDLEKATKIIEAADTSKYLGFNLVYGNRHEVRIAYGRVGETRAKIEKVSPGIHIVTNSVMDDDIPKVRRVRKLVGDPGPNEGWSPLFGRLQRALSSHEIEDSDVTDVDARWPPRAVEAACVHLPVYGTRSSSALAVGTSGVVSYKFADGPPCTTAFTDVAGNLFVPKRG